MHNPNQPQEFAQTIGSIFVGILLSLILKAALDTFIRTPVPFNDIQAVWGLVLRQKVKTALLVAQLLIFIFTLVRFYLGAYRYHQEEKEGDEGLTFIIDFSGAIAVFVFFYVAATLIRTTSLFYLALIAMHLLDLIWFACAQNLLRVQPGIRKVTCRFLLFDLLTLLVLIALFPFPSSEWTHGWYLWQFLSLVAIFGVGIWDLVALWPFYVKAPGWEDLIPPIKPA